MDLVYSLHYEIKLPSPPLMVCSSAFPLNFMTRSFVKIVEVVVHLYNNNPIIIIPIL